MYIRTFLGVQTGLDRERPLPERVTWPVGTPVGGFFRRSAAIRHMCHFGDRMTSSPVRWVFLLRMNSRNTIFGYFWTTQPISWDRIYGHMVDPRRTEEIRLQNTLLNGALPPPEGRQRQLWNISAGCEGCESVSVTTEPHSSIKLHSVRNTTFSLILLFRLVIPVFNILRCQVSIFHAHTTQTYPIPLQHIPAVVQ